MLDFQQLIIDNFAAEKLLTIIGIFREKIDYREFPGKTSFLSTSLRINLWMSRLTVNMEGIKPLKDFYNEARNKAGKTRQ